MKKIKTKRKRGKNQKDAAEMNSSHIFSLILLSFLPHLNAMNKINLRFEWFWFLIFNTFCKIILIKRQIGKYSQNGFIKSLDSSALYLFSILVIVSNDPELVECMHTYYYARTHSSSFNAHVLPASDSKRRVEIRKNAYAHLHSIMLNFIHFIFANSMQAFMVNLNHIFFFVCTLLRDI